MNLILFVATSVLAGTIGMDKKGVFQWSNGLKMEAVKQPKKISLTKFLNVPLLVKKDNKIIEKVKMIKSRGKNRYCLKGGKDCKVCMCG